MVNKPQNLDAGEESVVIGNIEGSIGNRSTIIGATDTNGSTILNHPMAVGHNASAGQNAIAIGTGALLLFALPNFFFRKETRQMLHLKIWNPKNLLI